MSIRRVAIAGATGYAGEELIRLLLRHPYARLTHLAASAKWERPTPIGEVYPRFARQLDLSIEFLEPSRLAEACDVAFLALPHGAAMALVPGLLQAGVRVIDLSGDFRLRDASLYARWYQSEHAHPELLADPRLVYGLTEFHQRELAEARLVANPGCYATSVLLACVPLFRAGLVSDAPLIVDAKSGLSGAGRRADASLLFAEMAENLRAYKVNHHQHQPEILQEIERLTGARTVMVFVPQVLPVMRGLSSTVYVRTNAVPEAVQAAYHRAYPAEEAPFVRVRPNVLPQLRDVVGTNYCDIGFVHDEALGYLIVTSALDNLTKGAAGQAIQNFNIMHGIAQTTGLT